MRAAPYELAARLRAGDTVYAAWSLVPSPSLVEALARSGYDGIVLDVQHGLHTFASIESGISAAVAAGAFSAPRIPIDSLGLAARVLDAGASAVIVPMVNTVADAQAVVSATRYPPVGSRSFGPARALDYSGLSGPAEYVRQANALAPVFAMIETATALENVAGIVALDGIDGLFVGPNDLCVSLTGGQHVDPAHPVVVAALDDVVAQAKRLGKVAGIYANTPALARDYAARGFQLIALGTDISFARAAASAELAAAKGTAAKNNAASGTKVSY